jgi:Transposase IS4
MVAKAAPFVAHVNKVSKRLCHHPGFALSIDEMMHLFKGQSIQTHCTKHKPFKEGYKFYALCCAQSVFVFYFFPDGRKEGNKIHNSVEKLLESVPQQNSRKYLCVGQFLHTSKCNGMLKGAERWCYWYC